MLSTAKPQRRSFVLAALLLAACSEPYHGPPTEVVQRLIPDDSAKLLSKTEVFEPLAVFTWHFESEDDLSSWSVEGLEKEDFTKRGVRLRSSTSDPNLVREAALAADAIHAIELALPGPRRARTELYWAGSGEAFSDRRRIVLASDAPAQETGRYLLDVASHPRWRGEIARLRIDPTTISGDAVTLGSVTGIRWVPEGPTLASAIERAWKVEMGSEVRNAWLAPPGLAITRDVPVEEEQRLIFAYGLEKGAREPVRFLVEATAENGATSEVFHEKIDPGRSMAGRWLEASVDLGDFAGQDLRLRFTTRSAEDFDLARGFPVWANAEIVGPAPEDRGPNVVLLSLDTLRADHLSAYGYGRDTSPNIDAWARRSAVLFQNTVVQAPWTLPSHVSLFTGWEAMRHGVNHFGSAPDSLETMAEVLRGAGYTTAAVTGGGYLRPQFGFAQGFDQFRYWPEILAREELARGMEHTLSWLSAHRHRRFFLFFHTYEIHYPHRRREPYFSRLAGRDELRLSSTAIQMQPRNGETGLTWSGDEFAVKRPGSKAWIQGLTDDERKLVVGMYDSAIAYTDRYVKVLFEHLEKLGLMDRTLVILTSDHGEALGEHGLAGHNYLAEHNLMVPLIIGFPDGIGAGRVVREQVRSIDVLPTVLDYLGLEISRDPDGVSLLPLVRGQSGGPQEAWCYASSANFGLALRYQNRWKYYFNNTAWSALLGDQKLYDLARDAAELEDLAVSSERTAALRERAREFVDQSHEGLRLEIVNRGQGKLQGSLTGAWASHQRVKAADPGCLCIHWEPGRRAWFSLNPGQRITLYFEGLAGEKVSVEGRIDATGRGEDAAFHEEFAWREVTATAFVFDEEGWSWRDAPAHDEMTGFRLWKTGGRDSEVAVPAEDPETLRQLRALGYVQ